MENLLDARVASKYVQIKNSAKKRGIYFDMSLKRVRQLLLRKRCEITGEIFIDDHDDLHRSFDRLDNDKGYIDSNVVVCTGQINKIKRDLTVKQIKQFAFILKKYNI